MKHQFMTFCLILCFDKLFTFSSGSYVFVSGRILSLVCYSASISAYLVYLSKNHLSESYTLRKIT